jgi:hypothetical protein
MFRPRIEIGIITRPRLIYTLEDTSEDLVWNRADPVHEYYWFHDKGHLG